MPGRDVVAPHVASIGRVDGVTITITLVLLLACALMLLSLAILRAWSARKPLQRQSHVAAPVEFRQCKDFA